MADAFADCTWTVQSHLVNNLNIVWNTLSVGIFLVLTLTLQDCPKTKTASLASFESYEDGLWRKK